MPLPTPALEVPPPEVGLPPGLLRVLRLGLLVLGLGTVAASLWGPRILLQPFCHQIPSRCPWWGGAPLGLCFRCSGLLLGAILGTLTSFRAPPLEHPRARAWLALALLPLVLDVGAQFLELYASNITRGITGLWTGTVASLALLGAAARPVEGPNPC